MPERDYFEYAREALRLGVDDYGLKPISKNEIEQILKTAIEKLKEQTKSKELQKAVGFVCPDNYFLPTEPMLKGETLNPEKETSSNKKNSSGVGLKNVAMRVHLFGCENCGIVINSSLYVGTNVKLIFPNQTFKVV